MIVDKDAQPLDRIGRFTKPLFQTLQHAAKAVVLNQKKEFIFRLAVMIKAGETDVRRPRNVAHRSRVIVLLGKNARRGAQDQLELLIVSTEIVCHARPKETSAADDADENKESAVLRYPV